RNQTYKPRLSASVDFFDFYGEKILYGGQRGAILIEIKNTGEGDAENITPVITPLTPLNGITFENPAVIAKLKAGGSMNVRIPLVAPRELSNGEIRFKIDIREIWGYDVKSPLEIAIKTKP
ncbi:hypothetical protein LLG96_12755, partial [bacterium]|nr:hypothetical protein [bacterium]